MQTNRMNVCSLSIHVNFVIESTRIHYEQILTEMQYQNSKEADSAKYILSQEQILVKDAKIDTDPQNQLMVRNYYFRKQKCPLAP